MATGVISSAVDAIFEAVNKNKDNLLKLQDKQDLTKVACLYEEIEGKARRCDRILANKELESSKTYIETAKACIESTGSNFLEANQLLEDISQVVGEFTEDIDPTSGENKAKQDLTGAEVDSLIDKLNVKFPGSNQSTADVGIDTANKLITKISQTLASKAEIKKYLKSRGNNEPTNVDLRTAQTKLKKSKNNAESVLKILNSARDADNKGLKMNEEDHKKVATALKNFSNGDEGGLTFVAAFNEMLQSRSEFITDGDITKKIKIYNISLSQAQIYKEAIERYTSKKKDSNSSYDTDGLMETARLAIRPHLAKLLKKNIDNLYDEAKGISNVKPPIIDNALKERLQTEEERVIYPLLRACNQLQSVMNRKKSKFNPTVQHKACDAFNCPGTGKTGNRTFDKYLENNGIKTYNSNDCFGVTGCEGNYDRYICEERNRLPSIRESIKNEFNTSGTICGKSISEALGG